MDQNEPDSPRRVEKRKNIEKLWRKGEARWRYEGEGESDHDFLLKKRSAPRKHPIVRPENERDALVVEMGGPSVLLLDGDEEIRARPRRSTTTGNPNSSLLAVGDRVRYVSAGEGDAVVTHVYPRKRVLLRTAVSDRGFADVIVANPDRIVVVAAATNELLKPGLIDRYLIASAMGGVDAFIVINKMDLVDDEDFSAVEEIADVYRDVGYTVLYTSCVTGEGIEELGNLLRDAISAFCGHSGVGKTSLLNRLVPSASGKTDTISVQSSRGTHTTTKSVLYALPNGGYIADTPGIREFGLYHFDPADLHTYYPEFVARADRCRFPSCTHTHEPDCAVIAAVAEGAIHPLRYRNYLQILDSEREER
ncbi:MAG: ribosome small subunit-dependent GTPase A [Bacteroidota bacterium]|nr:ribosome small subunit-dependent GTPase A [Bacteroidota bacterium]